MSDFYVQKGHAGSDAGTEANPYLTIDQGMNAIAGAGTGPHNIYIKTPVSGNYTEAATVDTAGTTTAAINVVGYDVSITEGPPVRIIIDGTSTNNYGIRSAVSSSIFYQFRNIEVNNSTGAGLGLGNADSITFINCLANNNGGGHGFSMDNTGVFFMCTSSNNSDDGFNTDNNVIHHSCKAFANADDQIFSNNPIVINTVMYGLSGTGQTCVTTSSSSEPFHVVGCTMDGENVAGTVGVNAGGTAQPASLIVNNIIYDLGIGVDLNVDAGAYSVVGYNLINSNTTDYANLTPIANTDVTTAPQFVSEGSDYALDSGSPAIDAGSDSSLSP